LLDECENQKKIVVFKDSKGCLWQIIKRDDLNIETLIQEGNPFYYKKEEIEEEEKYSSKNIIIDDFEEEEDIYTTEE
jgi:hypothetical protein